MRRNQPQQREDALNILQGHAAQTAPELPQFVEFGYWIDRQLARLEARHFRASKAVAGTCDVLVLPGLRGDGVGRIR